MDFNESIDWLCAKLGELARKYENYFVYEMDPAMDGLIVGYVKLMKERGVDRPEAYRRFTRGAALAFEVAHPGSMWKVFFLHGRKVCAYTLKGEFDGEEASTVKHLAYELGCDESDIDVDYESRRTI